MLFSVPAAAHEVWIDAAQWQVAPSTRITANLRNGELFKGANLAWLPRRIQSASVATNGTVTSLTGRAGDNPAFNFETTGAGLAVVGYQSKPATLTYDNYEKFESFADEKGFAALIANASYTPNPREVYTRFAKALLGVGTSEGSDHTFGFEIELIAETNPYTDPVAPMRLQLIYQDTPLPNARITVFERKEAGDVAVSLLTSNAQGRAEFTTTPGSTYLVDSVMLRRPAPKVAAANRAIWESLWASLTFRVPATQ